MKKYAFHLVFLGFVSETINLDIPSAAGIVAKIEAGVVALNQELDGVVTITQAPTGFSEVVTIAESDADIHEAFTLSQTSTGLVKLIGDEAIGSGKTISVKATFIEVAS